MNLTTRSFQPELMDGDDWSREEYVRTLRQLRLLNVLTNGYRPTVRAMEHFAARADGGLRVLDVGFGYGDTLREAIGERNRRIGDLVNLDDSATAWLVLGAPDPRERDHWRTTLGAEVVVMCTPYGHICDRIRNDPSRKGREELMEAWALKWWKRYKPSRNETEVYG